MSCCYVRALQMGLDRPLLPSQMEQWNVFDMWAFRNHNSVVISARTKTSAFLADASLCCTVQGVSARVQRETFLVCTYRSQCTCAGRQVLVAHDVIQVGIVL